MTHQASEMDGRSGDEVRRPQVRRPKLGNLAVPTSEDKARRWSIDNTIEICKGIAEVSPEGEPLYKGRKIIYWLLCLSSVVIAIPEFSMGAAIATIEQDINISTTTSGLILALPSFLMCVVMWLVLVLGKDIQMTVVVPTSLAIHGASFMVMGACRRAWQMVIVTLFIAIGRSVICTTPALVDHMAPVHRRAVKCQIQMSICALGMAIAYMVAGATPSNWRAILIIFGFLEILTAAAIYFFMKRAGIRFTMGQLSGDSILHVCKQILTKKSFLISVILSSGVWSPLAAWSFFIIKYITDRFYDGEENDGPGFILGISIIVAGLYGPLGGWLLDKYIERNKRIYGQEDDKMRINSTLLFMFATYPLQLIMIPILWTRKNEVAMWISLELVIFSTCLNPYTQAYIWSPRKNGKLLSGTIAYTLAMLLDTVMDGVMIFVTGLLFDSVSLEWVFFIPGFYCHLCYLVALFLYYKRQMQLGLKIFGLKKLACF